eukprot:3782554-Prymnesium_polylepis.1
MPCRPSAVRTRTMTDPRTPRTRHALAVRVGLGHRPTAQHEGGGASAHTKVRESWAGLGRAWRRG